MNYERLNKYQVMWLFVFFDLPTDTKKQRKIASSFRKKLLNDGFGMMQYSVYTRHCASRESAEVHIKRVKSVVPKEGQVTILKVTDQQYGNILNFWGKKSEPLPEGPKQLEMF